MFAEAVQPVDAFVTVFVSALARVTVFEFAVNVALTPVDVAGVFGNLKKSPG